jgi:hypothetical protein
MIDHKAHSKFKDYIAQMQLPLGVAVLPHLASCSPRF